MRFFLSMNSKDNRTLAYEVFNDHKGGFVSMKCLSFPCIKVDAKIVNLYFGALPIFSSMITISYLMDIPHRDDLSEKNDHI